jgi:hypothetical protein
LPCPPPILRARTRSSFVTINGVFNRTLELALDKWEISQGETLFMSPAWIGNNGEMATNRNAHNAESAALAQHRFVPDCGG